MKSFKQYISEEAFRLESFPDADGDGIPNYIDKDGAWHSIDVDLGDDYWDNLGVDWGDSKRKPPAPMVPPRPVLTIPPQQNPDDPVWETYPWAEGTIFLKDGTLAIPCEDCPPTRGCPDGYNCFPCNLFGTCQEGEDIDVDCDNPPCAVDDGEGNWYYTSDGENWFPWNEDIHGEHP